MRTTRPSSARFSSLQPQLRSRSAVRVCVDDAKTVQLLLQQQVLTSRSATEDVWDLTLKKCPFSSQLKIKEAAVARPLVLIAQRRNVHLSGRRRLDRALDLHRTGLRVLDGRSP